MDFMNPSQDRTLRAIDQGILCLLRGLDRLFGPRAAWADLLLGYVALCWTVLQLAKPRLFDVGALGGIDWAADAVWIAGTGLAAVLHGAALLRDEPRRLRLVALGVSGFVWTAVGLSTLRVEVAPSTCVYTGLGALALLLLIHVAARGD